MMPDPLRTTSDRPIAFFIVRWLGVAGAMIGLGATGAASAVSMDSARLADDLSRAAPGANPEVIAVATRALSCVRSASLAPQQTLSVIDYSLPSTQPRLWVFDLAQKKLLFEERVAHGRNTGANLAEHFSNAPGSLMSSLGGYETEGTYSGHNGYSLRLRGLEPGFNDRAYERAIVIHGANYVGEGMIEGQGRLGRSFGCPAVRPAVAHRLIDAIRDHSFVLAYYPDPTWLASSRLLHDCDAAAGLKAQESIASMRE